MLGWYLCERQVPGGGCNGRPEKLDDVCYGWWVLASLKILEQENWIDGISLKNFILDCQNLITGGIGERRGSSPDLFHTFFGLASLSLLQTNCNDIDDISSVKYELPPIDPVYALPSDVVSRLFRRNDQDV